jgi:hypothetical protein
MIMHNGVDRSFNSSPDDDHENRIIIPFENVNESRTPTLCRNQSSVQLKSSFIQIQYD